MHHINPLQKNQPNAIVDYDTSLIELDDSVNEIILERLSNAAGKESRSFQLDIKNSKEDSFYGLSTLIKNCDDEKFIETSCLIADLLAVSQRKRSIPGGQLLILDCESADKKSVYVVIKAELQKVISKNKTEGKSSLQVLSDVFLSPASKLFKIGILIERDDSKVEPNEKFDCFLYDEQFRNDGTPAEYFYSYFLGFSIGNNAKIQSKKFFDQTTDFIKRNISKTDEKAELLKALNLLFSLNQESTIKPSEFSKMYFKSEDVRDSYLEDVVRNLPSVIIKDKTLIESQLSKKKISFSNNINIIGPNNSFDENVRLIKNEKQLKELSTEKHYTIVVIEGSAYTPND